jgi:hypothetical protein
LRAVCRDIWLSEAAPAAFKPIIALIACAYGLQLYWYYYTLGMLVRALRKVEAKVHKKAQ